MSLSETATFISRISESTEVSGGGEGARGNGLSSSSGICVNSPRFHINVMYDLKRWKMRPCSRSPIAYHSLQRNVANVPAQRNTRGTSSLTSFSSNVIFDAYSAARNSDYATPRNIPSSSAVCGYFWRHHVWTESQICDWNPPERVTMCIMVKVEVKRGVIQAQPPPLRDPSDALIHNCRHRGQYFFFSVGSVGLIIAHCLRRWRPTLQNALRSAE